MSASELRVGGRSFARTTAGSGNVVSLTSSGVSRESVDASGGSISGSTDGHRYAKYNPAETTSPRNNARTKGSQITSRA